LQSYVHPKRPWRAVEFWKHGHKLTEAEGRQFIEQSAA
jgi:hypothetical protein